MRIPQNMQPLNSFKYTITEEALIDLATLPWFRNLSRPIFNGVVNF